MEHVPPAASQDSPDGGDPMPRLIREIAQGLQAQLPGNIHTLLESSLRPAEMPGDDTEKFLVDGHPDLLVRRNSDGTLSDRRRASQLVTSIPGINVIPHDIVQHQGNVYAITKLVDGQALWDALANNPSDTLLQTVDDTLKSLIDFLVKARLEDGEIVLDIDACNQYMVGTLRGDTEPRLWLVDLPSGEPLEANGIDNYEMQALQMANELNAIEEVVGRRLTAARQSLQVALEHFRDMDWCGDGLKQMTQYILNNDGERHDPLDEPDLLDSLRTR